MGNPVSLVLHPKGRKFNKVSTNKEVETKNLKELRETPDDDLVCMASETADTSVVVQAAITAVVRAVVVVLPVAEGPPGVAVTLISHCYALEMQPLSGLHLTRLRLAATIGRGVWLAQPAMWLELGQPLGLGQSHFEELVADSATTVGGGLRGGRGPINGPPRPP